MKISLIVKYGFPSNLSVFNYPKLRKDLGIRGVEISNKKHLDDILDESDLSFFGFADELLLHATSIPRKSKLVTWCRGFEIFSDWLTNIDWSQVDRIIFSGANLPDIFKIYNQNNRSDISKTKMHIIPTGVDLDAMTFKEREPGYNIAFIGHLTYRKNLTLLLYAFNELHKRNDRYKLFIAGDWNPAEFSQRFRLDMEYLIKEFGLEKSIFFDGWQKDINAWLENKNYLVATSLLESGPNTVKEAMAKGIKPLIQNFPGAKLIWPERYIWNTIEEFCNEIQSKKYTSKKYRELMTGIHSYEHMRGHIEAIIREYR